MRLVSTRLLSQPGIRALLLLVVLVSAYATYGYFHFYRDPLSIFFSEEHGFDQFYSATRRAEADAFIDGAVADPATTRARLGKAGGDPAICAVFTTIGRDMAGRQYVDTAVGSALANMSRAERAAVHLKLFFADVPDPEARHASHAGLSAADVADDVFTYPATLPAGPRGAETLATLEGWAADRGNKHALERKTLHDYAYALDRCRQTTRAPYIAMLEGDILLADGWAARTLLNLRTVEAMMRDPRRHEPRRGAVEPGGPNSWLYLRLFNQERSTGWSGGTGFRSNNVHKIAPMVAAPLLLVLLAARRWGARLGGRWGARLGQLLDGWTLAVVCGLAVPLFLWLFYASGKASLVGAPRAGSVREEFFGCCNQALVYNRAHAGALADFLRHAALASPPPAGAADPDPGPGRCDMLPRDFAWDRGLARLSAYPMLAQHAGRVSATDTAADEARRVWSMAFEGFDAARLAREHARHVGELFGDAAVAEMRQGLAM
ncbi:hypothetical protein GGR56DRAFT_658611 [Xylariaceae sp. FL0804]|nr:hypothetical protein GGR56DRAFT_658611 [Xylariaceae sp. FL0804]